MLRLSNGSLVVRLVSSLLETLLAFRPHARELVFGGERNKGGDRKFIE